MSKVEDINEN